MLLNCVFVILACCAKTHLRAIGFIGRDTYEMSAPEEEYVYADVCVWTIISNIISSPQIAFDEEDERPYVKSYSKVGF